MKVLKYILFLTFPLFLLSCSNSDDDDDRGIEIGVKNIEITGAEVIKLNNNSNVYKFSSVVRNNTNKTIILTLKYELKGYGPNGTNDYTSVVSDELYISAKSTVNNKFEKEPKSVSIGSYIYGLQNVTYKITN